MAYLQRNTTHNDVTLDNKNVALEKFYNYYQTVMCLPVKMMDWQVKGNKTRKQQLSRPAVKKTRMDWHQRTIIKRHLSLKFV